MRNLCMRVSYDGTAYHGFQSQAQGRTIQDEIEKAIHRLTGEEIRIIASGRTDAGVHAQGQIINFITKSSMELRRWGLALNNVLPHDIVITKVVEAPITFHSRWAAVRKTYHYVIHNYRYSDVFQRSFQHHHPTPLNVEEMQKAISFIRGQHDFTSFCSIKSTKESHIRTITDAYIEVEHLAHRKDQGQVLRMVMTGDGFLYHMVRIIAGTLIYIGEGKLESQDMQRILLMQDRTYAGPTASAKGLTLWNVEYDELDI